LNQRSTPCNTSATTKANSLVIPKGFAKSFTQATEVPRPRRSRHYRLYLRPQFIFRHHEDADPRLSVGRLNQAMSGKPPFIQSVRTSILTRNTASSSSFAGIIAMAVMTMSLFGTVNLNTELRQKGIIRKLATTPITRTDGFSRISVSAYHCGRLHHRDAGGATPCSTSTCISMPGSLFSYCLMSSPSLYRMILTRFRQEAQSAARRNAISFPLCSSPGASSPSS